MTKNKLLCSGYGVMDMMNICQENNWDSSNTILEIKNPNKLDSKWLIWSVK